VHCARIFHAFSQSIVLYYLWLQIIAGWLLSAIFIAGVTGLIRAV
jgi:hypothetical protein